MSPVLVLPMTKRGVIDGRISSPPSPPSLSSADKERSAPAMDTALSPSMIAVEALRERRSREWNLELIMQEFDVGSGLGKNRCCVRLRSPKPFAVGFPTQQSRTEQEVEKVKLMSLLPFRKARPAVAASTLALRSCPSSPGHQS